MEIIKRRGKVTHLGGSVGIPSWPPAILIQCGWGATSSFSSYSNIVHVLSITKLIFFNIYFFVGISAIVIIYRRFPYIQIKLIKVYKIMFNQCIYRREFMGSKRTVFTNSISLMQLITRLLAHHNNYPKLNNGNSPIFLLEFFFLTWHSDSKKWLVHEKNYVQITKIYNPTSWCHFCPI